MAESGPPLQKPQEVASTIVATESQNPTPPFPLPRVTIRFCTQCKWMLRAAYYAQELLSTFSTSLGEVALQPSTGGTFVVTIQHSAVLTTTDTPSAATIQTKTLWDRKSDGGFPETKELKRRVRDVIEPGRNLGHVDRDHRKEAKGDEQQPKPEAAAQDNQNMSEQQHGVPSGQEMPTSVSGLKAQSQHHSEGGSQPEGDFKDQIRKGHSRPMMPADGPGPVAQSHHHSEGGNQPEGDFADPIRKGYSRPMIPADSPTAQPQDGQEYRPRMAGGGNMPVVKPPGEARNAEVGAKMEQANQKNDKCEDCQ